MKMIELSGGNYTIVDDEDYDWLNQWRWGQTKSGYVRRIKFNKDKFKGLSWPERSKANEIIYMHRLVNNTPEGMHTDHINRNILDNRKCNLRTATVSQNIINAGMWSNNTSGHRGIYWQKGKWVAELKINQKKIYLGRHKDIQDAIVARKCAEDIYFK